MSTTTTKVKGTITQVLPINTFAGSSGKNNTKQGFIITTDDQYNPNVLVEVVNEKLVLKQGEKVDLDCNVVCRHWKDDKWFTSIQAWKKNNASSADAPAPTETESVPF